VIPLEVKFEFVDAFETAKRSYEELEFNLEEMQSYRRKCLADAAALAAAAAAIEEKAAAQLCLIS